MRVLLVGSYGPSLLTFRDPLIAAPGAAGLKVHVAAPDLTGELQSSLELLGAQVHDTLLDRQGMGFRADLDCMQRLTALYRAAQPGLVITNKIKPNIWDALAGACTGCRTVALVSGLRIVFTDAGQADSMNSRPMKGVVRWLYRRASNRNWRVLFQNPDDLAVSEAAGCLYVRTKVRVMNGLGIGIDQYSPAPPPATPDFLMVSRILGAKHMRVYVLAVMALMEFAWSLPKHMKLRDGQTKWVVQQ